MKRKILALFLTAALAVSVTACGSDNSKSTSAPADTTTDAGQSETEQNEKAEKAKKEAEEAKKKAEEEKKKAEEEKKRAEEEKKKAEEEKAEVENPIEEALKRMAEVDSMEMEMVMDMDMYVMIGDQAVPAMSVTTVDIECINDPLKIKVEIEDVKRAMTQSMSIYGVADENGNYVIYAYDGESWYAEEVSESELNEYNVQSSMEAQIGDTSAYVLEGTEKVNGADAYKYSCTITGDKMKEALTEAGVLNSFSYLGFSESDIYNMLDGLGEVVTYVYVDEETFYPVRYEMDMTEVIDALFVAIIDALGEQAGGMSMSVAKAEMMVTCSNFNGISDITVPEEALSAAAQ